MLRWLVWLATGSAATAACKGGPAPAPPAAVQIDYASETAATLREGFVHGLTDYTSPTPATDTADALISQTKPGAWRFSGIGPPGAGYGYGGNLYAYITSDYTYPARFGTRTVVNMQDEFNASHGVPVTVPTDYASFADLESAWTSMLTNFLTNIQNAGASVDWFDLGAEPDLSWVGITGAQRTQLLVDAYNLVKSIWTAPVKIVGPSTSDYAHAVMDAGIQAFNTAGVHLGAISWHELGDDPDAIAAHVADMRGLFTTYAGTPFCTPSCPEIHINEYEGENYTLVPGRAVGWLAALEAAGVDQATRACWGGDPGSPIPYQECFYGYDGLLMPDAVTPQPLYWVYKFYADLAGSRFAISGAPSKLAVIAGKQGGGAIGVLVGDYGSGVDALQLDITSFPWATASYSVVRMRNASTDPVAMTSATPVLTGMVTRDGTGTASLTIDDLAAGDAYYVTFSN